MPPLSNLSYEEFGKLRFLDFFPRTDDYEEDHDDAINTGIGVASTEGYSLDAGFASPAGVLWQTSEIMLNFRGECPAPEANALLAHLGLGLCKGVSVAEALKSMGSPEKADTCYLRFVVGRDWPYYVECQFLENDGLIWVSIVRKDLADKAQ